MARPGEAFEHFSELGAAGCRTPRLSSATPTRSWRHGRPQPSLRVPMELLGFNTIPIYIVGFVNIGFIFRLFIFIRVYSVMFCLDGITTEILTCFSC